MTAQRYLIIIEEGSANYSSYSPDVPGCVAVGATRDECEREMQGAIEFHLEGLRKYGDPIPEPRTTAAYVEVPAG